MDSPTVRSSVGELLSFSVDDGLHVSARLALPPAARACYVLAHGAGAGMEHPFMSAVAAGLAERGVATLRYQFPYMERRARRPDPPALDALAERPLLEALLARLGARASVSWLEDADHAFHVPARSGRNDAQVMSTLLESLCKWLEGLP